MLRHPLNASVIVACALLAGCGALYEETRLWHPRTPLPYDAAAREELAVSPLIGDAIRRSHVLTPPLEASFPGHNPKRSLISRCRAVASLAPEAGLEALTAHVGEARIEASHVRAIWDAELGPLGPAFAHGIRYGLCMRAHGWDHESPAETRARLGKISADLHYLHARSAFRQDLRRVRDERGR